MNATFVARLAPPFQQQGLQIRKLVSLALAFALLGTLAGCGRSPKVTAPITHSSSGPKSESEARQVAQQSAAMGNTYLEQAKSLLTVVTVHGARPALVRPSQALATTPDSTSFSYALQGYDIGGNPIDWATQSAQLASLGMDYRWYYKTNGDSLLLEEDVRSHGNVAGLDAAATRYVANATDTMAVVYNGYSAGYHMIYDYAGTSTVTDLTWEKSGTPTYPVAGEIMLHWHWIYEYWYGARHDTGDINTDATITFNGTRYATVKVGTYTFSLDLETGTVS